MENIKRAAVTVTPNSIFKDLGAHVPINYFRFTRILILVVKSTVTIDFLPKFFLKCLIVEIKIRKKLEMTGKNDFNVPVLKKNSVTVVLTSFTPSAGVN